MCGRSNKNNKQTQRELQRQASESIHFIVNSLAFCIAIFYFDVDIINFTRALKKKSFLVNPLSDEISPVMTAFSDIKLHVVSLGWCLCREKRTERESTNSRCNFSTSLGENSRRYLITSSKVQRIVKAKSSFMMFELIICQLCAKSGRCQLHLRRAKSNCLLQ